MHLYPSSSLAPYLAAGSLWMALPAGQEPWFVDISAASGIRVENVVEDSPVRIPINDHSRLGFVDLDGDGWDDIVCHSLYPNPRKGVPFEHLVYRNRGDGTFEHISDRSGLRDVQAGFFAFGDVDNDGDVDCFAGLDVPLSGHSHQILLNDGTGRFEQLGKSGVETLPSVAGNAVFADWDGDAVLDLFIGMGHTSYAAENALLLGRGDGRFVDVSERLGGNRKQPTNGSLSCDYDNDGDLDILIANYGVSILGGQNALFENDGRGHFRNVAAEVGFASQRTGNSWLVQQGSLEGLEPTKSGEAPIGSNGFGLDCGDVDRDGRLDVFLAAISHPNRGSYTRCWSDPSQLLLNRLQQGRASFRDATREHGLPFNEGDVDAALVDFDNDGRLDISLSRDRKYEGRYETPDQKAWFGLLQQEADGRFISMGLKSGINALPTKDEPVPPLLRMKNAQNHAWADIEGDGDLDLLIGGRDTGGGRPNFLFRNEVGSRKGWLRIRLRGDGEHVDRDAIGTRLTLVLPDEVVLLRELKSSRGMHNSMDTRWLHFGLADHRCTEGLTVRWLDGTEASFPGDALGRGGSFELTYPNQLRPFKAPGTAR